MTGEMAKRMDQMRMDSTRQKHKVGVCVDRSTQWVAWPTNMI